VVGAIVAMVVGWSLQAGSVALAQDAGSIRLVLESGPFAGEHVGTMLSPCVADAGPPPIWYIGASGDVGADPEGLYDLTLMWGGEGNDVLYFQIGGSGEGYYEGFGPFEVELDDRGESATLMIEAELASAADPAPVHVRLEVECIVVTRYGEAVATAATTPGPATPQPPAPTEAPPPTLEPVTLGSPAPDSTSFLVVLEGGPDAGTYAVWAPPGACRRVGEQGLMASYAASATRPTSVSVLVLAGERGTSGTFAIGFGSGQDGRIYSALDPRIALDDRGDRLSLRMSGDVMLDGGPPASAPAASPPAAESWPVDLSVECRTLE
jgi:hypothetical protein